MALSSNWKKLSKKIAKDDGVAPVVVAKYQPKKLQKKKTEVKKVDTRSAGKNDKKDKKAKHIKTELNNDLIRSMSVSNSGRGSSTEKNGAGDNSVFYLTLWNLDDITKQTIVRDAASVPVQSTRSSKKQELGKYVAIDCEFVGVGSTGKQSALARVSLVNFYGHVVYDTFVQPKEKVVDWRTWVSGVDAEDMEHAVTFEEAQEKVSDMLKGLILVGHATANDMKALQLSHPKNFLRDTSQFAPFRALSSGTPSLKLLVSHFMRIHDFQEKEHSSVEDARATMVLYRMFKAEFDKNHN